MRALILSLMLAGAPVPTLAQAQAPPTPEPDPDRCAAAADGEWTASETWAWQEICAGRPANMSLYAPGDDGDCDAPDGPEWPEARRLRASVIAQIATQPIWTNSIARPAVQIDCAIVTGALEMPNASVPVSFWIDNSRFPENVTLDGARFGADLSLYGSDFWGGTLSTIGARFLGGVDLRHLVAGEVVLDDTRIEGALDATGAVLDDGFYGNRLMIAGALWLDEVDLVDIQLEDARITSFLTLVGAKVSGEFYLSSAHVGGTLLLSGSEIGIDLLMPGATVGQRIQANGLKVAGLFDAQAATVKSDVDFDLDPGSVDGPGFGASSFAVLSLIDANIGGNASFRNATVTQDFDASGLDVGDDFVMNDAEVAGLGLRAGTIGGDLFLQTTRFGALALDDLRVGGNLQLAASNFETDVTGTSMRIGGTLNLSESGFVGLSIADSTIGGSLLALSTTFGEWADFKGIDVETDLTLGEASFNSLFLQDARIGGNLDATRARFADWSEGKGLTVDRDLILTGASFLNATLAGAAVGGDAVLHGAVFKDELNAAGLSVQGDLSLELADFTSVLLDGSRIGGDLVARGVTAAGQFSAKGTEIAGDLYLTEDASLGDVNLLGAQIGDGLHMQGSTYSGRVVLASAHIGEVLQLSAGGLHPTWGPQATLNLRNANAAALQAVMPGPDRAESGHSWRRDSDEPGNWLPVDLSNFTYDRLGGYEDEASDDLSRARPADMVRWIDQSSAQLRADGQGYAPQPYTQLAAAFRAIGADTAADEVEYARFLHRMDTRDSVAGWGVDALNRWVVGFGIYPERALYWFLALVALGCIVGRHSRDLRDRSFGERFWYSLQNALPLVGLSADQANLTHGDTHAVANFYHFQKVAGFLLATVLVGALTLLGG